ncbi:unnamed protein product [Blepharisma stoltei]|uniref:Bromodomain containing protein n=1 Tax=Blepharisma stoltei TaxID=1481888 RepID=A0AAU9JJR7_9CILI|nr:unnamed protein product [Blepharisma stoltei]
MDQKPESIKKSALSKDEIKKAQELIKHLEKRPESNLFSKPVDYKALGLIDYPLIISNPMDLSTVKKKLKSSKYSNSKEFLKDLSLIWENCKTYNQTGSPIYQHAEMMEVYMKKYIDKHSLFVEKAVKRPREDIFSMPLTNNEALSFESKIELAEKIRRAPVELLAEIVKIVESQCKPAIEELDTERIQIKMNALDKDSFDKIFNLINGACNNDEAKPSKKQKC